MVGKPAVSIAFDDFEISHDDGERGVWSRHPCKIYRPHTLLTLHDVLVTLYGQILGTREMQFSTRALVLISIFQ